MRSDERLEVLSLMMQVVSGVGERAAQRLERHGLTTVDLDVLVALGGPAAGEAAASGPAASGPAAGETAAGEAAAGETQPTMSDVAARTGLTASGATRVVDRLVGRGLVARSACATDRRITHVSLTAAGRRLLDAALPDHLDVVEAALLRPLRGTGQVAAFTGQLRLLRDALVEGESSAVGAA
jgi:MarR family transcriptional regulator, 2-MHQ and catechol-resistance regulon repressor